MRTGWRNKAEWQASQNSFFFSFSENPSIPPHSVIPYHFWMTKNENYNGKIAFNSHSGHFHFIPSFENDVGMTEWGQMKGVFLSKAKPLNLKTLSFGYIPSFHLDILFLIGSFHSFEGHFVIPISFQFQINKKTSHADAIQLSRGQNEKIGCCLYKRQHLIISFLGHSSVIPTSFHEQYWTVLYLNETGMTEWQWNDPNGVWMK